MIKPEMVPEAAWQQASGLWFNGAAWPQIIAAALNAWPGLKLENLCGWVMDGPDLPYVEETASIILPLPQEASDDE